MSIKDKLIEEEFKQAGHEYTFFQDLALKYLTFYTATLGAIIAAFITILTVEFKNPNKEVVAFLKGPFLSMCGLFLIFMGFIVALVLLRCRDKTIDSIKSMISIRKFSTQNNDYSKFAKSCYYAFSVPRYYRFLSPTQGVIIILATINSIAFSSLWGGNGVIHFFSIESIKIIYTVSALTFLQYLLVYNYMIRKDTVRVKLKFKPEQNISEIKLEYNIPGAITNNSFSNIITRVMFYLIGLTEKEINFFERNEARKFSIKDNEIKELKLIAGHYKIIASGTNKKDLLIFGNIYEAFTDTINFQPDDTRLYEGTTSRSLRKFGILSKIPKKVQFFLNTILRYLFYFFLLKLTVYWEFFRELSWIIWVIWGLIFIHFLHVLLKPFYKLKEKGKQEILTRN